MLPTELLSHRQNGESIVPLRLKIDAKNLEAATEIINCFQSAIGKTQGELDKSLQSLEGDSPDYRLKRGFAHLLRGGFSTFEIISPLEPIALRQRVFALAAQSVPSNNSTQLTLETLALELGQELNREVLTNEISTGLYADLNENKILTQFDAPTPEALLHRYNLSQVQGIFYRASQVELTAHRNDPGEYKLLFRYLKLFQLMTYIEGDAERMHSTLQTKDPFSGVLKTGKFTLNSECGLVSHYPPGKPYDSMLEAAFAERWNATKTEWKLEREVDLIPIPGSVMIPDFRLVHPDG
ncbi:MAG: DUF790 family protein, partial [Oscillatoriales cyanobacterium]